MAKPIGYLINRLPHQLAIHQTAIHANTAALPQSMFWQRQYTEASRAIRNYFVEDWMMTEKIG
jgi:hypothetical protein